MVNSLALKEQVVEDICEKGCQYVNHLLQSTEFQSDVELLQPFDEADKQWILNELNAVMSVYN